MYIYICEIENFKVVFKEKTANFKFIRIKRCYWKPKNQKIPAKLRMTKKRINRQDNRTSTAHPPTTWPYGQLLRKDPREHTEGRGRAEIWSGKWGELVHGHRVPGDAAAASVGGELGDAEYICRLKKMKQWGGKEQPSASVCLCMNVLPPSSLTCSLPPCFQKNNGIALGGSTLQLTFFH